MKKKKKDRSRIIEESWFCGPYGGSLGGGGGKEKKNELKRRGGERAKP